MVDAYELLMMMMEVEEVVEVVEMIEGIMIDGVAISFVVMIDNASFQESVSEVDAQV